MTSELIGKVTATERQPTTCNSLKFWVNDNVIIKPFDIVRVQHISSDKQKSSYTYAIVQDLQYITDSVGHLASYVSSDFGDASTLVYNKRIGTTVAEAEVLYNNEDIEMPVQDGALVEWADSEGIKEALGIKAYNKPIPAGYIRISNGIEVPIELESDYLLGPEGAHLNIAGISGLATKTSYAVFLLNSIQQRYPDSTTMIIFNVKGKDLLSIDKPNDDLDQEKKAEWEKCGLTAKPFTRVKYLYPYADNSEHGYTSSHVILDILKEQQNRGVAHNYYYDLNNTKPRLPLLFSDIDDPSSTMESIAHEISSKDNISSWDSLFEIVDQQTKRGASSNKDISVLSWRKFSRVLRSRANQTKHHIFREKDRLRVDDKRQVLVRDEIYKLKPGDVLVIDVEPLPDYLQSFVFGDVLQVINSIKLGAKEEDIDEGEICELGKVVIFADELNKYAPKSGGRKHTLTEHILEITERGRSLGTILFGVEQFRSGVEDRVLGNCSTNVYGRTSPIEISKCPDYRYFPDAYKSTITRLIKGCLLLQHAVFKTSLIKVHFPYPSYFQPKG